MWYCLVLLFIFHAICGNEDTNNWKGRWFPFGPGQKDKTTVLTEEQSKSMLTIDYNCDDGKTNLTLDWDKTNLAHACLMPKVFYKPNPNIHPIFKCEHIPKMYSAQHICMNQTINYDWTIPTFGPHRPVWARYGEYKYLPKQRWLHNLEHGAVVMLYHPCANMNEVRRLKRLVKECIWRHVITPERFLSAERPLVLITWGCRLEMSYVYAPLVRSFIKKNALHGAEEISRDGLYDFGLVQAATVVSDKNDTNLCPDISTMM